MKPKGAIMIEKSKVADEGAEKGNGLSDLAKGFIAGAEFGAKNPDYSTFEAWNRFKEWVKTIREDNQ